MATPASRRFLPGEFKNTRRICRVCGAEQSIRMFHISGKHRSWVCISCWREMRKEYAYFTEEAGTVRVCVECGRETKRIIRGLCKSCYERRRQREVAEFNRGVYGKASGGHLSRRYQRAKSSRLALRVRRDTILAYGGKCMCCGERRWDCLSIHHVNGGGRAEAKMLGGGGLYLYRDLQRRGFPKDGYQLLCMNCNASLAFYGYCPHQNGVIRHYSPDGLRGKPSGVRYTVRIRMEIIAAYGGCCSVCGVSDYEFLTVDHIAGDGKADRDAGLFGRKLYMWLRRNGFPKDRYRLLCMNCNHALGVHQHNGGKWQRGHRSKDMINV